jgi:hypothetical protein
VQSGHAYFNVVTSPTLLYHPEASSPTVRIKNSYSTDVIPSQEPQRRCT